MIAADDARAVLRVTALRDGRLDVVRFGRAVRVPTSAITRPRSRSAERATDKSLAGAPMDHASCLLTGGAR